MRASEMSDDIERNLGVQPIAQIMEELGLKAHDLVAASDEHLTHKMVARACKGRRLTSNVRSKILNAMNELASARYSIENLFNY